MENTTNMENYTIPKKGIRDRYKAEAETVNGHLEVTVYKDAHYDIVGNDATYEKVMTGRWVKIASYHRNYSGLLKTFEPFQQFHDGEWKDYALISVDYETVSILDLETGVIIMEETDGAGFCPAEFYVPDWWDYYDESYKDVTFNDSIVKGYKNMIGNFGVYAGCYWGDDTSWKIQHIDLSRLCEGIVTTDNRFGYVSMPDNLDIHEAVVYDPQRDTFDISLPVTFNRDGKALHKEYTIKAVNWA